MTQDDQDFISHDRIKNIGKCWAYFPILFDERRLTQAELARRSGKTHSQVSRDIPVLLRAGLIKKEEGRRENIIEITPYGVDVYKAINPYSKMPRIELSEGVKVDLHALYGKIHEVDNDIWRKHIYDEVLAILDKLPYSNWDEVEGVEEFVEGITQDFHRRVDHYYQQFPLALISKFIEKGYPSEKVLGEVDRYFLDKDPEDPSIHDFILKRILHLRFLAIQVDVTSRGTNISRFIELCHHFRSSNRVRMELYDMTKRFNDLDRDAKDLFKDTIKETLQKNPTLKMEELEYILREVSG